MTLKDAAAKLKMQFQTIVLWNRTYRAYSRSVKHLKRGMLLKEKGDKYRARAEKIEELMGVFDNG